MNISRTIMDSNNSARNYTANDINSSTELFSNDITSLDSQQQILIDYDNKCQKIAEEIFSVMTRVMDKSIDLYVQQENLVALLSTLAGLLYNRANYDIFKDMDLNVLAMHTTSYIKSHIPNLLYLKKAHNVANDMMFG